MKRKILRKNRIEQKLKEIADSVEAIKENLPATFDEFKLLGLKKDGIYKKTEFIIQNMIDVCSIINSDLALGIVSEEISVVSNLFKNNILSAKWETLLKEMKGFRNILTHEYSEIDDEIAFENINT